MSYIISIPFVSSRKFICEIGSSSPQISKIITIFFFQPRLVQPPFRNQICSTWQKFPRWAQLVPWLSTPVYQTYLLWEPACGVMCIHVYLWTKLLMRLCLWSGQLGGLPMCPMWRNFKMNIILVHLHIRLNLLIKRKLLLSGWTRAAPTDVTFSPSYHAIHQYMEHFMILRDILGLICYVIFSTVGSFGTLENWCTIKSFGTKGGHKSSCTVPILAYVLTYFPCNNLLFRL